MNESLGISFDEASQSVDTERSEFSQALIAVPQPFTEQPPASPIPIVIEYAVTFEATGESNVKRFQLKRKATAQLTPEETKKRRGQPKKPIDFYEKKIAEQNTKTNRNNKACKLSRDKKIISQLEMENEIGRLERKNIRLQRKFDKEEAKVESLKKLVWSRK